MNQVIARVGERVRNLRLHAGMTQARLAYQAGISRRHLAALEKGANVSAGVIAKVADVLHVSMSILFDTGAVPVGIEVPRAFFSAFISYGAPDEDAARRLYDDLSSAGVECFFFPVSATPGRKLHRTMAEGIRTYERLILVASAAALSRRGVSNELEQVLALEAEEGGSDRIIPVALDDCLFSAQTAVPEYLLGQLRRRVIADFRRAMSNELVWRSRVEELLRALRRS